MLVNQREGAPGLIKGFRDPAHFRDPADGTTYLLFTGSLKPSHSAFNGCIGIARASR
jgi:levansucrase